MRTILTLIIVALPALTHAFVAVETDISQPYEIVPIEAVAPEQVSYLGTLNDYPVMYEVVADEAFTFTAQLSQSARTQPEPLSLLLIRRNDRGGGVAEITRQPFEVSQWTTRRDSLLGMSLHDSPVLSVDVEPGTYRLEVSAPDNSGQFMLTVGTESPETGYFDQLGYIRQTQTYFGYSFFSILRSSLVYYPIGILLLLGGFYQTWRFSTKRRNNG